MDNNLTDFEKQEIEGSPKTKPKMTEWIGLGQQYGISVTIWDEGITIEKKKKTDKQTPEGKNIWESTQKMNISNAVIKELFIRLPEYYKLTKKKE